MRGVMAVRPMSDIDFDVLVRCHRLIGVEVRRDTAISLSEAAASPALMSPGPSTPFAAVTTAAAHDPVISVPARVE